MPVNARPCSRLWWHCVNGVMDKAYDVCIWCSPCSIREIWRKKKRSNITETSREATPTKIGLHAYNNLNLHEFFELILFVDPMPGPKAFLKANKKEPNLRNWRSYTHQNWLACKPILVPPMDPQSMVLHKGHFCKIQHSCSGPAINSNNSLKQENKKIN